MRIKQMIQINNYRKNLWQLFYLIFTFFFFSLPCHANSEILVLKHALRAGDIVSATDLEWETTQRVPTGAARHPNEIIGKSAKTNLPAGLALYPQQFEAPKLISQGQTLEVLLRSGALEIRYTGVAMQDGVKGQTINVRMPSGTTIGATVLEPGRVLIP